MMILALLIAVASSQPTPGPYAIYNEALRQLTTLPQPKYIVDTQRQIITKLRGGEINDQTENVARYVYDTNSRLECGFFLPFNRSDQPVIGPSYFGPDTWIVRKGYATGTHANTQLSPDLSDIKTIANVVVVRRPSYDIRLLGTVALTNNGLAYHLSLRPLFDPVKHNLRELWVNTATYNIVRAVIEGPYKFQPDEPAQDTFVTEDFGNVGGYWLVTHKTWRYAQPFSPVAYDFNFTSLTMQFPTEVPDWLFDLRAFESHTFNATDPLFSQ